MVLIEKKKKSEYSLSMRCTNPLYALNLYSPKEGKKVIKVVSKTADRGLEFYINRYGEDCVLQLPCGRCLACLSRRSKEWAVRCALEATLWPQNCFVTLTYDQKNYPGKDVKDDLKKFFKSLRNAGIKCRYYACCEKGDEFGRYHYHAIIFNFMPKDIKPWAKSKSGFMQYTSEFLDKCWDHKGLVTVADFHPFNAQYVAGYVVKKLITGDKSCWHIQSLRPGIGAGWFFKNAQDVYDDDKLILDFGLHKFSVPRYFDKLAESLDIDLTDIKARRLDLARISRNKQMQDHRFLHEEELFIHNQVVTENNIKIKDRRF